MTRVTAEIRRALAQKRPVVALESSVIAQGLPFPENVEAWRRCEAAVRKEGAVPATLAVVGGHLCVGLSEREVETLAAGTESVRKLAASDLAVAAAQGLTGGTTVSATVTLAARVGIRILATGGIGGVHRGAEETFDVSQDLAVLARHPVSVVCSGAKSVLDLAKTLEVLEALAIPVVGVGTKEFPAFYTAHSGLPVTHTVESPEEAVRIASAQAALGGGGILFAVPPPQGLPREFVERALAGALAQASRRGIRGPAVTPFLLKEMARRTQGQSLAANLALLERNAACAGQIACAGSPGEARQFRNPRPRRGSPPAVRAKGSELERPRRRGRDT